MPNIVDVFSGDAFSVKELTDAINLFPNQYGLINALGLFQHKGVATTSVGVEINKGVLNLIQSKPRGAQSNKNIRGKREMRFFEIPHFPLDDNIFPSDIQNVREFGSPDQMKTPEKEVADRLMEMSKKHDITHEYLNAGAIAGQILDADGSVLLDIFDEFGVSENKVDFDLADDTTEVSEKTQEVWGTIEDSLEGDPRYLGFWLTGLFGDPESETVKAEGYITFAANPADGSTITINGTVFTFVDDTATGNQIEIQATVMQTIDEAVTKLNASVVTTVDDATYSRPVGTQKLKILHDTAGAAGNAFTLAASVAVVSGTTLTGGGNQHSFASGSDDLPSYSLEVGMNKIPAYFVNTGVVMNSIGFDFQRSGAATASVNVIAQGETRFNASQGGTPEQLTFKRTSQFQGEIRSGGENIGNLTSGTVSYSNNLERIETIRDDGKIDGADPTIAALTGSITVRFADTTLIDLASSGTPIDLEFIYTLSPGLSLRVTAHEVYLPKPKLAVTGAGGIEASFDFQGAKNEDAGCMVTVKLLNDLDGTDYQ